MICICGHEVKEPPYENWEECPSCDLKLDRLEWRIKRNEERENLLRVARAAKEYHRRLIAWQTRWDDTSGFDEWLKESWIELEEALKAVEDFI